MVFVTWAIFLRSIKSTAWKRSTSGTPYLTQAFWNLKTEALISVEFRSITEVTGNAYSISIRVRYRSRLGIFVACNGWIERDEKICAALNSAFHRTVVGGESARSRHGAKFDGSASRRERRQVGRKTKAEEKQKRSAALRVAQLLYTAVRLGVSLS